MTKRKQATILLLVALIAGVSGYKFFFLNRQAQAMDRAAQGLVRLALPDPSGRPISMAGWDEKILIVNFWATWCVPCREEIPELIKVQRNYGAKGVQVVGIAIDNAAKVEQFSREMSIDYALLIGDMSILEISKALGNKAGVLPYTVVLDGSRKLAYAHAGAVNLAGLDQVLTPMLQLKSLY